MKKIKMSIIMMLMFCLCFSFNINIAKAESSLARLNDNTSNKVLNENDVNDLNQKLDEISNKNNMDIAVVLLDGLDGKSKQEYADDFYDSNNFGMGQDESGIILLVNFGKDDHGWYISAEGAASDTFDKKSKDYIGGEVASNLKNKDYKTAITNFINLSDQCISAKKDGKKFPPHKPLGIMYLGIALVVGLIIALIVVLSNKAQLNSVHKQEKANDYMKKNSLNVTNQREIFLYSVVNRTEKPKDNDNSIHESSSGDTHSGSGGDF